MKIGKVTRLNMIDEFENAFSRITRFESVEFYKLREAAEVAADAAISFLEFKGGKNAR